MEGSFVLQAEKSNYYNLCDSACLVYVLCLQRADLVASVNMRTINGGFKH